MMAEAHLAPVGPSQYAGPCGYSPKTRHIAIRQNVCLEPTVSHGKRLVVTHLIEILDQSLAVPHFLPKPMLGSTSIAKRLERTIRNRRRRVFAVFLDRRINRLVLSQELPSSNYAAVNSHVDLLKPEGVALRSR